MLQDDLKVLGLSTHEIEVYLALIGKGKTRAGEIIRRTGLHRNLVYQALEALSARRLIAKTTQKGIFQFQLTDVGHLKDVVREQEIVADRVIESLRERVKLTEQEITVYEGEDAIRTFSLKNANALQPGDTICVLGSGGTRFETAMGDRALKTYFRKIAERGASIRILMYTRQMYGVDMLTFLKRNPSVQIRTLPIDVAPTANVVFTQHSVAFQIFEQPFSVLEIRNTHLVQAYRNYFELLWKQNVRVEQGTEALREAFYGMVDALRPGEEYYVLGGNIGREYSRLSAFFDDYHRYRIQHGVTAKILAQHEAAPGIRERNHLQGDPEDRLSQVKAFQTPFLSPMQINLYQGRAVMVLYKEEPTVLYFDDPEVYQGFRLYFDEIWNRKTETFYGHDGIISLCELVLEQGKDLYLIAATGSIFKTHPDYYRDFTKRRVTQNLKMHILANEEIRGGPQGRLPLSTVRYLPKSFASPMVIWIFGDTVAHVLWHEPEIIFLIHDAPTAEYYRQYYSALIRVSAP